MTSLKSICIEVFLACDTAIVAGKPGTRTSKDDKEFHFQNWFKQRLEEAGIPFEQRGRNSFPDFQMEDVSEGYEVKSLAFPGRHVSFDANSKVPTGFYASQVVFYVFGRYPKEVTIGDYQIVDLVICHGDFLNPDHEYLHQNRNVIGFGSYGDILIRDRKMYVVPTPYALTRATTQRRTLILPKDFPADDRLEAIGQLIRVEADESVVGYEFDLITNSITPHYVPNPTAGQAHTFMAYQAKGEPSRVVSLSSSPKLMDEDENGDGSE